MQKNISEILKSFVALFFPRTCPGCSDVLEAYETVICTSCRVEAPLTNFCQTEDNLLKRQFQEWFPLNNAIALLYFQKKGIVAQLIHEIKYRGNKEIGAYLGTWLGSQINESKYFKPVDAIIPVPLHPKRERKRGFNQAAVIARAVEKKTNIPVFENLLVRIKNTKQLVKMKPEERWREVENAFAVSPQYKSVAHHFLLIDDVITTGATLSGCGKCLLENTNAELSVASVAYGL